MLNLQQNTDQINTNGFKMTEATEATLSTLGVIHSVPNSLRRELSWYDYVLFDVMLLVSALIGIYFGFFGKKQSTSKEYLMGGKEMKAVPIAISLVAR